MELSGLAQHPHGQKKDVFACVKFTEGNPSDFESVAFLSNEARSSGKSIGGMKVDVLSSAVHMYTAFGSEANQCKLLPSGRMPRSVK